MTRSNRASYGSRCDGRPTPAAGRLDGVTPAGLADEPDARRSSVSDLYRVTLQRLAAGSMTHRGVGVRRRAHRVARTGAVLLRGHARVRERRTQRGGASADLLG